VKFVKSVNVIKKDTGEVVAFYEKEFCPRYSPSKGYCLWPRAYYTKQFTSVKFPDELTMKERGMLATLSKEVFADTNMLGRWSRGSVRPLTVEEIGEITGLKKSQTYVFLKKLIRLNILRRVKVEIGDRRVETQFYLNPLYYSSSNYISLNLYLVWKDQLDPLLPGWVKEEFAREVEDKKPKLKVLK